MRLIGAESTKATASPSEPTPSKAASWSGPFQKCPSQSSTAGSNSLCPGCFQRIPNAVHIDARQRTDFNAKGKKIFDGFAPGENFKARPGPEILGEVAPAAQEAADAVEQQRIPKAARDLAKGYFKNLGGQDDKPAAKAPDKK